jgi:hypothetical protein
MLLKRLLGNAKPAHPNRGVYARRLVFDQDPVAP